MQAPIVMRPIGTVRGTRKEPVDDHWAKERAEIGIFAQRAKRRPNRPVLDLKPWVDEFGPRGAVRQPAWMTELMKGYF